MAETLGIPYARCEIVYGRLVRICPFCKEMIPEVTDKVGEEITNNYADHFYAQHSSKPKPAVNEVLREEMVQ